MLLLANGVAGFIGNIAGGWLAGRDARLSVIVTGIVLGGAVTLLTLFGSEPWAASGLVIVWGFGFGMLPISIQSLLFKVAGDRIEGMQALLVVVAQAAIGSGALFGGLVADHAGVGGALLVGGVAALTTSLFVGVARVSRQVDNGSSCCAGAT